MAKKKEENKRELWQYFVQTFFNFCRENFGTKPSFDGSAPRDLAGIYDELKKRVESEKADWNVENATGSLELFLTYANQDKWLHENFILFNLNRHKDKVFFKMKSVSDGKQQSANLQDRVQSEFDRRYGSKK